MNYVKDSLSYYFKNFVFILILSVVPAVFLGLLIGPFGLFEFLSGYVGAEIHTFGDLFYRVYHFEWISILWIALGLIVLVAYLSVMLGFIENHFRTGKSSLINACKLNSNVLSVTKAVLLLLVFTFVVNVLLMLFVYLVHCLTANNGVGTVLGCVLNFLIAIFGLYPIARVFSVVSFATVEMLINGSPMRVALSNAFYAVGKNAWQVFGVEALMFLVSVAIVVIFALINLAWLGEILGVLFLLPMLCVFAMEMFFDYYNLKKYNNRKYYNLR